MIDVYPYLWKAFFQFPSIENEGCFKIYFYQIARKKIINEYFLHKMPEYFNRIGTEQWHKHPLRCTVNFPITSALTIKVLWLSLILWKYYTIIGKDQSYEQALRCVVGLPIKCSFEIKTPWEVQYNYSSPASFLEEQFDMVDRRHMSWKEQEFWCSYIVDRIRGTGRSTDKKKTIWRGNLLEPSMLLHSMFYVPFWKDFTCKLENCSLEIVIK